MDGFFQDVRQGLRVVRAKPVLAGMAILSLALAIGPNTAIFSVVDALGLRPLPVRDPGGLLRVTTAAQGDHLVSSGEDFSYPEYADIRSRVRLLDGVAASTPQMLSLRARTHPAEVGVASMVSSNYFGTLGIALARGRAFRENDDQSPSNALVAVISDRLWRRRFDADPKVVGETLRLNTQDFTVIGVTPAGFDGTQPVIATDLWLPFAASSLLNPSSPLAASAERRLSVIARLAPGASLAEARAEIASFSPRLSDGTTAGAEPRRLTVEREESLRRRPAALLGGLTIGIVSLVLLIACANVAGLLLGSAEARRAEVAIRVAMGASRGRLVRQLLTESAVVSILAAAAGVLLAWWLVRLIPALIPAMPISFTFDFRIDRRVLVYTLLVAVVAAPLFGLVPALVASRPDLTPLMKGGPSGRRGIRRLSLRHLLVVGEVAVALVLLIASGLFVRSFIAARGIDPGFTPRPMIFTTFAPPVIGYNEAQSREFYAALLSRLEAIPGIERASMVRHLPLNALYGGGATYQIHVPGHEESPNEPVRIRYNVVEASYFETMGVPIVEGRAFDASDRGSGSTAAIVNQTMARRFWKSANPIGQYFTLVRGKDSTRECQVVGVARDGKYLHINEAPQPYLYLPFAQQFSGEMTVIARYRGEVGAMTAAFRREVQALDPAMPTFQIVTLDQHLRLALFAERLLAALMGTLGGLGLLLSVVGLYGIVSQVVARRTREIGIRIAVGASPWQVVRAVLADGGRLTVVGLVLGVLVAWPSMKVAESMLNGVSPRDPLVYGVVVFLVLAVALGATWVPARRAARVDPVSALRAE